MLDGIFEESLALCIFLIQLSTVLHKNLGKAHSNSSQISDLEDQKSLPLPYGKN